MARSYSRERCAVEGCRRLPWANDFCLMHLVEHLKRALPDDERNALDETIINVLKTLTYRERELLKLRYGWLDGYTYTPSECGRIFKVSRSRVYHVEHNALRKLSHPVRLRKIQPFLEIFPFDEPTPAVIEAVRLCDSELMRFVSRHPGKLYEVSSREFEQIIAEILRGFGFEVELTQKTRDGGRDIIAFSADKLKVRTKYIVECKRYSPDNPVRVELVRPLYGVQQQERAQHSLLATTSYFTADAEKFARDPAVLNLHLKGFRAVKEWLKTYNDCIGRGAILL